MSAAKEQKMQKLTLQQLGPFLWETSRILWGNMWGNMDASELKDYIFGILFLKRLSDEFDEAQEKVIRHYLSSGMSRSDAERLASDEDEYDKAFFVPEQARWSNLKDLKHDIGSELNKATEAIEGHNLSLEGVLVSIDFNIKNKLSDKKLQDLLSHFSKHRLRTEDFESPNLLGDAYEYLINQFAELDGGRTGEFNTPKELKHLLVSLLKPKAGMKIYDPTAGSGGMLMQTRNYLIERGENAHNLSLYGQEINLSTWSLLRQNMFINGVFDADVRHGDTLEKPQHVIQGELMSFDIIISNPPFGLVKRDHDFAKNDPYGRFVYGIPPEYNSDFAFIQHMIASLNAEGRMGVVVSHGVLFSRSSERDILKGILEDDLIEAVIKLPSALFYGTGIPAVIIIMNKNKESKKKGEILYVAAEQDYEKTKFRNKLREADISRIVSLYENWEEEEGRSTIIKCEELREYSFDLGRIIKEIKFEQRVSSINTEYKKYECFKLGEVALDIVALRSNLEDAVSDNDIYIPRLGHFAVVSNREAPRIKDNNLFRVSLDKNVVSAKYLTIFFKSEFGNECINKETSGTTIPNLPLSSVKNIMVSIPNLEEQQKIINTANKLSLIKGKITEIESALRSNPIDDSQSEILESIISSVTDLSLKVSPLLCEESIIHEFKASLRTPFPAYPEPSVNKKGQQSYQIGKSIFKSKGEIHNYFENIVLKTIASFLNTRGGTLVIGVHEYGNEKKLVGVDREGFESSDKYERHLIQKLNNAFGAVAVSQYITVETVIVSRCRLCVVRCNEDTGEDIFYLNDVVYVRTGPRIDKLSTKDVVELSQIKRRKNS